MDWVNRMNEAMEYIETHLQDVIDHGEISKIAACSFSSFQQIFSQVTGISISEYVRRRKLTCAAFDLQNTEQRIIDIAQKYGYESADAFSVAFKRLQGVTPTTARKQEVRLVSYCRLDFKLSVKGIYKMDYKIMKRPSFKVIGVRQVTPYGGGTWGIVKSGSCPKETEELLGRFYDLGLCFGFGEDGSNDYMCAIEWDKDDVGDLDTYEYPEVEWIMFEAKGKVSDQVLMHVWKRINEEFLPQGKYRKSGLPTIEKYVEWDEVADECLVEIWIPVALKES